MDALRYFGLMFFIVVLTNPAPARSEQPRTALLATGVAQAGRMAGERLLCANFDGTFTVFDLATGGSAPWRLGWEPQTAGWTATGGGGFEWRMAVSPDGMHVALATGVGIAHDSPDGEYTDYSVAIILSGSDGSDARCVAMAEITDGGPPLDFTHDSSRLVGPWFLPCEPSPTGYAEYIANVYNAPQSARCNYIDTATRLRGYQANYPADVEFYSKATESDYIAYFGLDALGYSFGTFAPGATYAASFDDTADPWTYYQWVLPDALLANCASGAQMLVYVDGKSIAAPEPAWYCYATLSDGTCLFSNDRGLSVKYGKVDWPTFTVDWWVERPDLQRFAEPLSAEGWPERLNDWVPLWDEQCVVITPDTGDVVLVQLSRDGAKP